ncbi:nuclear anchorage protein 1-like, partial [Asbolus verrucosus]
MSSGGPPDPPSGKPCVSADMDSVTVAWSSSPYDGGKIVTGFSVEYSLAGNESAFEPRIVTLEPGLEFKIRFEVLEELGKGRFGVVHKVVEKTTAQKLAAKFIKCRTSKDKEKVQDEIDIMNLLRHQKLLQLAAAFENPKEMIMVTEYISGGELFERVVADDFTLTEKDCILFMRQICEGVAYMHSQNVVHLDLKPENIMCHTRTSHEIKIIDFGLAQKLNPDTPVRVLFGTPEFIPPEIINYEPIGIESDMWSLGVICYVLLSGLSPFMGDNDAETFANITRADYDFEDEAFNTVSQNARDFIGALLLKRKEDRLSAEQCLKHTWLDPESHKNTVVLSTDKLKKFIIRRKWQKTGNAIRALGRMATLSASRRNSANSSPTTPRPSITGNSVPRMSSLNEENTDSDNNASENETKSLTTEEILSNDKINCKDSPND